MGSNLSWVIYLHHLEQLLANLSHKHSLLVFWISFRQSKDILLHHGCNNFLHWLHPVSFTWKTASQKTAKKSAKKELLNPVIQATVVQNMDSAIRWINLSFSLTFTTAEKFGLQPIKPISATFLYFKSALLDFLINHISRLIQTPSFRNSVY